MNTRKLLWITESLLGLVLLAIAILCCVFIMRRSPALPETPEQRLLPGGIAIHGRHIVVHAPAIEQHNAEHLAALGDEILQTYGRYLNTALPGEPIPFYLLDTVQDYERADALYNDGKTRLNLSFSQGGRSFVYMQPRPGQTIIHSADRMEELLAHELCHALQQRLFLNYNYQPVWLQEGVAEAWSEHVLSHTDSTLTACDPYYGTRIIMLRRALHTNRFVPISQLMQANHKNFATQNSTDRHLFYAESFAFVRMLDDSSPGNAVRRKAFHEFLSDVNRLLPDETLHKANARFLTLFAPDLSALQQEMVQRIQTDRVFPWEAYSNQVCPLQERNSPPEKSLEAEAFFGGSALAFRNTLAVKPGFRIRTQARVANVGTRQVVLLFGRVADSDYYSLCYGPGYVTLLHYKNSYQTLASQQLDLNRFAPGLHQLDVKITPRWIEARLDGKVAAKFALETDAFPAGQWGVGCYDGRVTFQGICMQQLSEEEKDGIVIRNTEGTPVIIIRSQQH